jgi:site-specific DNA-methyltransferase (adenine-specific)
MTPPPNADYAGRYLSPYYDDGTVTIYHADCRELLDRIAWDVTITDPPYGVGLTARQARNRGRGGSHPVGVSSTPYDDDPAAISALIAEVAPKITHRALIFCGSRMMYHYPPPAVVGAVYLPAGCGYTPWGFQTMQPILYYGVDPYLADGKGHRPNGFIDHGGVPPNFDHPCPKPLRWMSWAVNRASRSNETILDPFAGTGTTLIAAKQDGRSAIGIDIEERFCEIAAKRLDQGTLDLDWVSPNGRPEP